MYFSLSFQFECCVIKSQLEEYFCYSNMHESIVNYGTGWTNHDSYIQNGLFGNSKGVKVSQINKIQLHNSFLQNYFLFELPKTWYLI